MSGSSKMHDDEVAIDASLVRRLVAEQFPQWAQLDVETVRSTGTDNAMYRLGDEMAVRLPRRPGAVRPMDKEHAWLPRLGPSLPLPVPLPLAKGSPAHGYPWPWTVCRWIEGENPALEDVTSGLVTDLASFLRALQAIDATAGPLAGGHNYGRGAALAHWESTVQERLTWLTEADDVAAITDAWNDDARTAPWDKPPVWIHGDLGAGNLLVRSGRLSGVIDWSCLGVGDPACELQVAWRLFDDDGRQAFKTLLGVDDATWRRGRAWGLALGVLDLSYYRDRSPELARLARRTIASVLADRARGEH